MGLELVAKGYLNMQRKVVNQIQGQAMREACECETVKEMKNGLVGFEGLGERGLTR